MPGKASGSVFSTLFSCGFQRKTATTSGAEIEAAATARAEKEKAEAAAQLKAATEKKAALFPNIDVNDISIDVSDSPDEEAEAGAVGVPFTEVEHEEEWEGWLDWSAVDTQTTGGGASTDV